VFLSAQMFKVLNLKLVVSWCHVSIPAQMDKLGELLSQQKLE
jgi:hypothetical protein